MTPFTPRQNFDHHLQKLLQDVLIMGSMVSQAVQQSVTALQQHDLAAAQRLYLGDQQINERRYAIENECITLIATQQPMARDVRFLAAILEIITELERIGDYAKGIAKINIMLTDYQIDVAIFSELQQMSDMGLSMLEDSLNAFVTGDAFTARKIPVRDDCVDNLYNHIYHELTRQLMIDSASVDQANFLIWAAHNLERLADRVINICERTVYVATGEVMEFDEHAEKKPDRAAPSGARLPKVLFLCTHNSARSQMAEAFLRKYAGDRYEVHSAGLEPGQINPYARRVMAEIGVDLAGQRSKGLTEYLGKVHFAYLITVCDRAEQLCPIFPGMGVRLHWSHLDPSAVMGSEEEILSSFRQVHDEINSKILDWVSTQQTRY